MNVRSQLPGMGTSKRAYKHARTRSRTRAFTLVEVMVSLGVMVIGAMAIIGLQQHAIRANSNARQLETGLQIAQTWIERLKQDAHTWTTPATSVDGQPTPAVALANTLYLNRVVTAPDVFQQIPSAAATATASNGFDYRGFEIDMSGIAAQEVHYCASFKPSWVIVGRALRVDVRVWWPRDSSQADMVTWAASGCADDDVSLSPAEPALLIDRYHIVYLSTVIVHTRVPR
jgi:Tfp pilus assembly protein PilV